MSSATLLTEIFSSTSTSVSGPSPQGEISAEADFGVFEPTASPRPKLVIFTEHRDTLNYLLDRITTLLGRKDSVVVIHGSMGREERLRTQESFRHDPDVQVLLATDAAGEGINLQRAHLMVNYDLPWNPNRMGSAKVYSVVSARQRYVICGISLPVRLAKATSTAPF